MNIVFFGTSDRSIPILEALKSSFNLTLCITKEDAKFGRHLTQKETKVKQWARTNRIKCLTITSINPETTPNIIEHLLSSKTDLGVVCDFSFIIPQAVIDTPRHKIINIHFSLLPKYRGASPVQHAILSGDKITGITYYVLDKGMDTGDILYQSETHLSGNETSDSLYTYLFEKSANDITEVISNYVSGKYVPKPQEHDKATYTYSKSNPKNTHILKLDAKIDWSAKPQEIERMTRAFTPWPAAWTTAKDLSYALGLNLRKSVKDSLLIKIHKTHIDGENLVVDEAQVEGKKRMSWEDFLNGYAA